jgi:hypothetical protein
MPTFKVVFEIEVDETSPLAAAQTVQGWLAEPNKDWQFYVQGEDSGKIFSVDLQEPDLEDAEMEVLNYTPIIDLGV